MRVAINQLTALGAKTGIGNYTAELLRGLRIVAPGDSFEAFPPRWWGSLSGLGRSLRGGGRGSRAGWKSAFLSPLRKLSERALGGYLGMARCLSAIDLYHEPDHVPLASSLPTVATVHDLSVLVHPEWHPADRVARFERCFARGLQQCRHLLAVSEFTRQELMRVLNVPADKITCTPNGVRSDLRPLTADELASARRRLGLPERFLLFVGTIEPRKNLLMLLRAYCDLPASVRDGCPLVLAGGWGWNAAEFRAYFESEAIHRGVVHRNYVPDEDMAALYSGARALVFPSLYEGFGLPPLEMMACGGAVLASTARAIVDVVGDRAHLIEPADIDGWRDAMQRIIRDDEWLTELRTGVLERASAFTWERCARQTLEVYRQVANAAHAVKGAA
jgi:alpha-1,3-rhamnosyl/mannosyltransferase